MLKIFKIILFLQFSFLCLKAQKDSVFLINGKVYAGELKFSDNESVGIYCEKGLVSFSKKRIYKVLSSNGSKTVYNNLTFLEKGLSPLEKRKILLPIKLLPAEISKHQSQLKYNYAGIFISKGQFFEVMKCVSDAEINESVKQFKRKSTFAPILIVAGIVSQVIGGMTMVSAQKTGGEGTHVDNTILYTGAAIFISGVAEASFGFALGAMRKKIRQKKLIDRYNSLLVTQ